MMPQGAAGGVPAPLVQPAAAAVATPVVPVGALGGRAAEGGVPLGFDDSMVGAPRDELMTEVMTLRDLFENFKVDKAHEKKEKKDKKNKEDSEEDKTKKKDNKKKEKWRSRSSSSDSSSSSSSAGGPPNKEYMQWTLERNGQNKLSQSTILLHHMMRFKDARDQKEIHFLAKVLAEIGAKRLPQAAGWVAQRFREIRAAKMDGGSWEKSGALSLLPGPYAANAPLPDGTFHL